MKARLALSSMAGIVLLAGSALAATTPKTGTVQSVSANGNQVTLQNGSKFVAGKNVDISGLKPGTQVTLYYVVQGNRKVVKSFAVGQ